MALIALPSCSLLFAQSGDPSYKRYTMDDGLVANNLVCLLQDDEGYLWAGTTDGVSRFNGAEFVDHTSEEHRPGRVVHQIFQANDSLLLFATSSGLGVFNKKRGRYMNELITDSLLKAGSAVPCVSIIRLPGKRILISGGQGLHLYDQALRPIKSSRIYDRLFLVPNFMRNPIFLSEDSSSVLLSCNLNGRRVAAVSTTDLTISFPDTLFGVVPLDKDGYTAWAVIGREGSLLLSGEDGHLQWFDAGTKERISLHAGSPHPTHQRIRATVVQDPHTTDVWLGAEGGLYRFDLRKRTVHLMAAGPVSDVLLDKDGTIWAATGSGLLKVPQLARAVHEFAPVTAQSMDEPWLHHVCADDEDHVWVASWKSGIHEWGSDGAYLRRHDQTDVVPAWSNVWSIAWIDRELYACTGRGVDRLDRRTHRFVPAHFFPDTLRNDLISGTFLFKDSQGLLWVGLSSTYGLVRYDEKHHSTEVWGSRSPVGPGAHCPLDAVSSIAEDGQGNMWFGSRSNEGILVRWDRAMQTFSTVAVMADGQALQQIPVNKLLVDRNDVLWIATPHHGLLSHDIRSGRWQQFDRSDGLPGNTVADMVFDSEGLLWVCNGNGLAVLDPRTRLFRAFTSDDSPLFGNTAFVAFPFAHTPDRLVFSNGFKLLFADRKELLRSFPSPVVLIDRVLVEGEPVFADVPHTFSHDMSHFTFSFAAIDLRTEGLHAFSYMLEVWDKGWTTTTSRSANYANVAPGTYTFKVKLALDAGDDRTAAFTFSIAPPFYRTWWFTLLIIGVVGSALYTLHLARLRQVMKLERIRSRLSRDLHDDIGSTLSSINILSAVARKRAEAGDSEGAASSLAGITERSERLQRNMSDIVWSMDPNRDSVDELIARMREFGASVLEPKGIAFRFEAGEDLPASLLPEVKGNLYLIFKESLNNAAKHSGADRVDVSFTVEDRRLHLRIVDNGKGLEDGTAATNGGGNGLRNMKARVQEIHATLNIHGHLGSGTAIHVDVPL